MIFPKYPRFGGMVSGNIIDALLLYFMYLFNATQSANQALELSIAYDKNFHWVTQSDEDQKLHIISVTQQVI